ncbi:hypothetical protein HPNQ4076_1243 [Helicobacter pylori NQ4076]|uniref:Uncharacterized protein n=1 Tax=Helicobacter pylori NQ4076 TaxID=992029 RepID=I9QFB5_HELPX|nr:hypothetical protein HPNQ4076_1243 [Helicobacter pylori NQ4076]
MLSHNNALLGWILKATTPVPINGSTQRSNATFFEIPLIQSTNFVLMPWDFMGGISVFIIKTCSYFLQD